MKEKREKREYDRSGINKQTLEVPQRNIHKKWEKMVSRRMLNQEEVIHRIENNLPLNDLYNNVFTFKKENDGNQDL